MTVPANRRLISGSWRSPRILPSGVSDAGVAAISQSPIRPLALSLSFGHTINPILPFRNNFKPLIRSYPGCNASCYTRNFTGRGRRQRSYCQRRLQRIASLHSYTLSGLPIWLRRSGTATEVCRLAHPKRRSSPPCRRKRPNRQPSKGCRTTVAWEAGIPTSSLPLRRRAHAERPRAPLARESADWPPETACRVCRVLRSGSTSRPFHERSGRRGRVWIIGGTIPIRRAVVIGSLG
jgi:hypothetical protein